MIILHHFFLLLQLECGKHVMHGRARKSDDEEVGGASDSSGSTHHHGRNKRSAVPFPDKSGVKHLFRSKTAVAASPSSGRDYSDEDGDWDDVPGTGNMADTGLQSAALHSHDVHRLPDQQKSIAQGQEGEVVTQIGSKFAVRGEDDEEWDMMRTSDSLATLDQLMDDSLSLDCLTTPGVLILLVLLTSVLLAVSTLAICLSIRMRELAQQLKLTQSRQLHESFSIVKKSPFVSFPPPSSSFPQTVSSASTSPVSCLFDQETILPTQTSSSSNQRL